MSRFRLTMLAVGTLSHQWPPVLGAWVMIEVCVMFWHLFTDDGA